MNRKVIEKLNILAMILPLVGLLTFSNNIFVCALIIIIQMVMILINERKYSTVVSNNFLSTKIILLICIMLIFSLLFLVINGNSIEVLKTTTIVMVSLVIEMLLYVSDKKRTDTFKKVSKYIVNITVFLCVYSIALRFFGNQYIIMVNENEYKQIWNIKGIILSQSACGDPNFKFMVGSLTRNPNSLSYLCLFSLIINMIMKNENNKKVILSTLLLVGLFISGSRMAIVLLPIAYMLYFLLKKSSYKNRVIKLIFEILIVVLIFFLLLSINTLIDKINFNGRSELWETTLEEIDFIGRGLGADVTLITEKLNIKSSMHNSYLSFLINYGYIVFGFFILFNIITVLNKKNEIDNDEKITSYILYVSLLIISLVESTFFVFGAYQYWFFYCLFNLYTIEKEERE